MTRVTDEQLEAWGALAEAAAPGPWWVEWEERNDGAERFDYVWAGKGYDPLIQTDANVYGPDAASAKFICAAREAVPALVAEVRRLRAAAADPEAGE